MPDCILTRHNISRRLMDYSEEIRLCNSFPAGRPNPDSVNPTENKIQVKWPTKTPY